jgi:hypothetical protein
MTSTSPDLPRPNRRGFSRDSHNVVRNHRDAARMSPQRRTAPSAKIARQQSTRRQRITTRPRPRLQPPDVGRPHPHWAWNGKARGDEGWRKDDRGRPGQDLRRRGGRLLRIVGKASVKSREGPTTIKSWCSLLLDARWFGIPLYLPPHANQRASHRGNPRNGSFPALSAAFVRRDIR